jgi:transcription termination factor Rho
MHPQEININRISTLGIYELRELGRRVGVARPTALKRDELVKGIKECIDKGNVEMPRPRGRKPRGLTVDFSKIANDDGDNSYFNQLMAQGLEIQVRGGNGMETKPVEGFVHVLPSGVGVLVGTDLNGYNVSVQVMRTQALKTGDYIQGTAVFHSHINSFLVEQVSSKCKNTRFNDIGGIRPTASSGAKNMFLLGERVLFVTPKPFNRLDALLQIAGDIKDAHKITLLIDETDDVAGFLRDGMDEVYLTKVNHSIKKQTMACLMALFRAKAMAEQGKHVILFIDSLNRLFKIYNNSFYPDGRVDPNIVNLGPLVDLKTFFLSARALENGGSVSVVAFVNSPSATMEEYIYNEFADLAQRVIKN